jgi:hypothetical protein
VEGGGWRVRGEAEKITLKALAAVEDESSTMQNVTLVMKS